MVTLVSLDRKRLEYSTLGIHTVSTFQLLACTASINLFTYFTKTNNQLQNANEQLQQQAFSDSQDVF